jgi:hypothetical protein
VLRIVCELVRVGKVVIPVMIGQSLKIHDDDGAPRVSDSCHVLDEATRCRCTSTVHSPVERGQQALWEKGHVIYINDWAINALSGWVRVSTGFCTVRRVQVISKFVDVRLPEERVVMTLLYKR